MSALSHGNIFVFGFLGYTLSAWPMDLVILPVLTDRIYIFHAVYSFMLFVEFYRASPHLFTAWAETLRS